MCFQYKIGKIGKIPIENGDWLDALGISSQNKKKVNIFAKVKINSQCVGRI